jgi:hypothetical protein
LVDSTDLAPTDNYTIYDGMVSLVDPVFAMAIEKNSSNPWTDVRLMCLQTNEIAPGSRVPPVTTNLGTRTAYSTHLAIIVIASMFFSL